MTDNYNRIIDYLRISVTDRCNLRCIYCMPPEGILSTSHDEILKFEEIFRLCKIFAGLGVDKFKITGGEPLIRSGVAGFISELKALPGVNKVTLTTNGLLLDKYLHTLTQSGVDGINISLDTLNPTVYKALTGSSGHERVMCAISGFSPVKINCIPLAGINDNELLDIVALANKVSAVRFIELMPVKSAKMLECLSANEIKLRIESAYGQLKPLNLRGNGPAKYYSVKGLSGHIGIISAISHSFCSECNRIRLTADGRLRLCLAYEKGINIKKFLRNGATDNELAEMITAAVADKPARHNFAQKEIAFMSRVGG